LVLKGLFISEIANNMSDRIKTAVQAVTDAHTNAIYSPQKLRGKNGKNVQNYQENCDRNWRANCAKIGKICARVAYTLYGCGQQT